MDPTSYQTKVGIIIPSYMLSNEILRFLSEFEIDITIGGH